MRNALGYLYVWFWGHFPGWSENWKVFPHCNGQAQCWMHITRSKPWCRCVCAWCRIARKIRRLDTTSPGHPIRSWVDYPGDIGCDDYCECGHDVGSFNRCAYYPSHNPLPEPQED